MSRTSLKTTVGTGVVLVILSVLSWILIQDEKNPPVSPGQPGANQDNALLPVSNTQDRTVEANVLPAEEVGEIVIPEAATHRRLDVDLSGIDWRAEFNYMDSNQYPNQYADLRKLAENGDANAAYFLWQALKYCSQNGPPPMDDEEFAKELRVIRENYQLPQYKNGVREVVDLATLNISQEAAEQLAMFGRKQCNEMPVENRGEAQDWMDFALRHDSKEVAAIVARERATGGDDTALMDLWLNGDPKALNMLSGFFSEQYQEGIDPTGRTRSFAYWLAFRELHYASGESAGPEADPMFGNIELTTSMREEGLLPGQIAEAEEIAADILRTRSSNCCVSLHVSGSE